MAQNERKTVLIARFSALGDVAMTVPVVYSACRTYPEVRFVMVTRKTMVPIFQNPPENLILEGFDLKTEYKGTAGIWKIVAKLVNDYHPEVFVDLHDVLRTKMMRAFLRLRGVPSYHLDKDRHGRREILKNHITSIGAFDQRDRFRDVFRRAGFTVEQHFDGLFDGHALAPVSMFAQISGPKSKNEHWVGIAPFAAHEGKIYPTELMERVVELLAQEKNTRIFLFGGGQEEKAVLQDWAERYPGCTSLAGKRYGFAVELALMNHLDVMLTMDSGNMHLAAIAGTRVLSIWGATAPSAGFTPWNGRPRDMIQADMPCRPCSIFGERPCTRGSRPCLTAITPEEIIRRVL